MRHCKDDPRISVLSAHKLGYCDSCNGCRVYMNETSYCICCDELCYTEDMLLTSDGRQLICEDCANKGETYVEI